MLTSDSPGQLTKCEHVRAVTHKALGGRCHSHRRALIALSAGVLRAALGSAVKNELVHRQIHRLGPDVQDTGEKATPKQFSLLLQ